MATARAMQLIHRRGHQARAAHAQWVADGDRAAVRVDPGVVVGQAKVAGHGKALRGEGFVELDHVHLRQREAGLRQQYTLSRALDDAIRRAAAALQQSRAPGDAGEKLTQDLQRHMGALGQLFGLIEGADVAPTTQAVAAVQEAIAALDRTLAPK